MRQQRRQSREFARNASTAEQLTYCSRLPKVELSAHLNGCVRDSTLRRAARCGRAWRRRPLLCCRRPLPSALAECSLLAHGSRAATRSKGQQLRGCFCCCIACLPRCRELAAGMLLDGKPVCLDELVGLAETSECFSLLLAAQA